ncbi:MAG: cytochrome c [bacterium]|nr:cytochrome c [bacterium]
MTSRWCLIGLAAVLGVVMPAVASDGDQLAADPQLEAEDARSRGALLFQIHCASCHGLDAGGEGPVADHLRVPPADLADLLAPDDSGDLVFPVERLRQVIDGREDVRGHGSREMPVWGLSFQDAGRDANQEEVVLEKINDLVEYLRTLQVSDADEPPDTNGVD